MTVTSIVGVITFVGLVLFLIVAYFKPPKDHGQYVVLRLIAMILAGVAGGIISGQVVVEFAGAASDFGKLAGSASGAIALPILIWFTFPKPPDRRPGASVAGAVSVTFPDHTNFHQAADTVAKINGGSVKLRGFSADEEATPLSYFHLSEPSKSAALRRLADLVPQGKVRPFEVRESGSHFDLVVAAVEAGDGR